MLWGLTRVTKQGENKNVVMIDVALNKILIEIDATVSKWIIIS